MTLVLYSLRSDKSLNLGGFGVWLLAFAFGLDLSSDYKFSKRDHEEREKRMEMRKRRASSMRT